MTHPPSTIARQTLFWIFLLGFFLLWTCAWLLRVGPAERFFGGSLRDVNLDTLYWFLMKCLVWMIPVMIYLRRVYGVGLWEYLSLSRWMKRGWAWGLIFSLVMVGLFLAYDAWRLVSLVSPAHFVAGPFLGAVLVAPMMEEVFFRGFMIRQLQGWWKSFSAVNLTAALAWALVHWVGWYFQGRVTFPGSLLLSLQLTLFGMVLGYANRFSGSLWTSLILHCANNLYSDHFWNYFLVSGPTP